MKNKLLIASQNQGKIDEISSILVESDLQIISAKEMALNLNTQETGVSYSENARLKAKAYLEATGIITLADDSGLEVDALAGAPGIYSARFSPNANADDRDRRIYLLEKLGSHSQPWKAHFHCSVVIALPGEIYIETNGTVQGMIISEERGTRGFGYDPIFFIPEFNKTMAELESSVKNTISHRAKAIFALSPFMDVIKHFCPH
jgi:XTP/dITP diphosphohydrolase